MSLNDSISLLQESRVSQRGLIRTQALENSGQKKFSSKVRQSASKLNQSAQLNDSLSYIPNDVYLSERTFASDTLMPVNNTYMKLDPSIAKQKIDALFDHFLTIAQGRANDTEIFDTVQDLIQACSDTFDDIIRNGGRLNEKNVFDGFGWLNQEKNTWKLLQCLYKDRILGQRAMDAESEMNELWLHSSEKEIIDKLYEHHQNLREYQLIVDWLEQCASEQHYDKCRHFADETISWENTLHQLQNIDKTVFGSSKMIVKNLDPDAPLRQNLPLHDLDMEDEQRISKQILFEIRQGRLDEAGALCERMGQFWRAAILEGWRLHHDPNYRNVVSTSEKFPIEGNARRDLWKKLAWQMAESSSVNDYTRAYMGILCGNLDALLGPLSSSWFDLLWAYLKVQIDICVESELRTACTKSYVDMPSKYWNNKMAIEQIFDELGAHKNTSVREAANQYLIIIQKYIILDDIPELIKKINEWIDDIRDDGHMLRFITHLVLFLRQIDRPHQNAIADKVIKLYVEFLIREHAEAQPIAFYTAALPPKEQVGLYASFLQTIDGTEERKLAISEAYGNGLDFHAIVVHAVEGIRRRESTSDAGGLQGSVAASDEEKISALEWLTFHPEQVGELLWQSNAMIRSFLAEKKIEAVRKVFKKVPQNAPQQIVTHCGGKDNVPAKIECSISEYHCHYIYLNSLDAYNDWLRLYHSKPKEPDTSNANAKFTERIALQHKEQAYLAELERWNLNLMDLTKITRDAMFEVLTFANRGYLVDPYTVHPALDEDKDALLHRAVQLEAQRKLCIPQIVLLLHHVLHSAGDFKAAVSLADDLASEQWQLYAVYSKQDYLEILGKISESSLALMNEKKDPWGYSIAT